MLCVREVLPPPDAVRPDLGDFGVVGVGRARSCHAASPWYSSKKMSRNRTASSSVIVTP